VLSLRRGIEKPRSALTELTPEQTHLVAGGVVIEFQHNGGAVWLGVPNPGGPLLR
jgi:hypothetical protein